MQDYFTCRTILYSGNYGTSWTGL